MPGLLAPGASEVCPRPGGAQRHRGLGLCRAPSLGAGRLNHPAQCHYGRRHAEAVHQDQITSRIALQVASVARPLDPHETLVAAVPALERTLKCVLQGLADAPCDMDVGGGDVRLSGAIAHHHDRLQRVPAALALLFAPDQPQHLFAMLLEERAPSSGGMLGTARIRARSCATRAGDE